MSSHSWRLDQQQPTDCLHGQVLWILWVLAQPLVSLLDTGKRDAAFSAGVSENRRLPDGQCRLSGRNKVNRLLFDVQRGKAFVLHVLLPFLRRELE